ncbi:hypothetical protein NG2371_03379 [Nocardia gamkensis]|nr:hypothetical protein [Nocardia gamkensis]
MVERVSSSLGCVWQGMLAAYGVEHPEGEVPPIMVVFSDLIVYRGNEFNLRSVDVRECGTVPAAGCPRTATACPIAWHTTSEPM